MIFLKAVINIISDNDVIKEPYLKHLSDPFDPFGKLDVGRAWLGITAWMIVKQDNIHRSS